MSRSRKTLLLPQRLAMTLKLAFVSKWKRVFGLRKRRGSELSRRKSCCGPRFKRKSRTRWGRFCAPRSELLVQKKSQPRMICFGKIDDPIMPLCGHTLCVGCRASAKLKLNGNDHSPWLRFSPRFRFCFSSKSHLPITRTHFFSRDLSTIGGVKFCHPWILFSNHVGNIYMIAE